MKRIAVLVLAAASHAAGMAGPLGLEMGMPLARFQSMAKLENVAPHQFRAATLPDGHPDFDDYRLIVTPQHGLCKVVAWSKSISTNIYGTELSTQEGARADRVLDR